MVNKYNPKWPCAPRESSIREHFVPFPVQVEIDPPYKLQTFSLHQHVIMCPSLNLLYAAPTNKLTFILLGSSNNSCLGRIWISSTNLSVFSRLYKRRPLSERHFRKEHSSVRLCVGWDDEELPRFWRFCRGTLRTLPFTCTVHFTKCCWFGFRQVHPNYVTLRTFVCPDLDIDDRSIVSIEYVVIIIEQQVRESVVRNSQGFKVSLNISNNLFYYFKHHFMLVTIYFIYFVALSLLPASRSYANMSRARPGCSTKCVTSSRSPGGGVVSKWNLGYFFVKKNVNTTS